jgi:hypothetical protein
MAPVPRQYAPLGLHPPEQRRAWKGRQYIKRGILDSRSFQEINGVLKYLRRVMIESKHNSGLHRYAVRMDALDNP